MIVVSNLFSKTFNALKGHWFQGPPIEIATATQRVMIVMALEWRQGLRILFQAIKTIDW